MKLWVDCRYPQICNKISKVPRFVCVLESVFVVVIPVFKFSFTTFMFDFVDRVLAFY